MSSSPLSNLPASRTYRSSEDNPPIDPSTSSSQSSRFSQMSCFRADKSIAKRLLSTCLDQMCKETFAVRKPDMSHCCRSRFLPLTNIELSSHVNDGSSSSKSMFNSIGQCVSFCHQCTATNSFDSRRTPTQRVNKHLFSVQYVRWCQCCDASLLRFEVLSDPVELFLFLTETDITDRHNDRVIPRKS